MKEIISDKILLYNPETGKHESITAIRGESAYEAAVRLGYTTLTEEQWIKEYNELAGQVGKLSKDIDRIIETSINAFDKNHISETGFYHWQSGQIKKYESDAYSISHMITVTAGDVVRITHDNNITNNVGMFVDGNGAVLALIYRTTTVTDKGTYYEFTVPAGYNYIKVQFTTKKLAESMVIINAAFPDNYTDHALPKFSNEYLLSNRQIEQVRESVSSEGALKNKTVMFFGDSLTSASTSGVNGFAKLIAEYYRVRYDAFVRDNHDGNTADTETSEIRFVNYGKDGTTNRIVEGRTDSVVERVKRHIAAETTVDYVLIECCVNDAAGSLQNKGELSDGYTATYDTGTTFGAIEETIRYLTTLERPLRVGFFIPWTTTNVPDAWFDDYLPLFKKWGMPVLDLRFSCGFNARDCAKHKAIYTLSVDSYEKYSDTTIYNLDDKVKYAGSMYKCKSDNVIGIPPTNEEYWTFLSSTAGDGQHLNNLGHAVVTGKIQKFLESL